MRLDIYRRPETDGKYSFLAVPEENQIPEEATNTDWVIEARSVEVSDGDNRLADYSIEGLNEQLAEKGYAMTALH